MKLLFLATATIAGRAVIPRFAPQTLSVLRQHLQMAQQVGSASGSSSQPTSSTSSSGGRMTR